MIIGLALKLLKIFAAYTWPSYLTYKALRNGGDVHKWAVYWCVMGAVATIECIGDVFLFWLPLYRISKIFTAVYLWHPVTDGAKMVYHHFLMPYLSQREVVIDAKTHEMVDWICRRWMHLKEETMTSLSRGALTVVEKAQGIPLPDHDSPRISAFREEDVRASKAL